MSKENGLEVKEIKPRSEQRHSEQRHSQAGEHHDSSPQLENFQRVWESIPKEDRQSCVECMVSQTVPEDLGRAIGLVYTEEEVDQVLNNSDQN